MATSLPIQTYSLRKSMTTTCPMNSCNMFGSFSYPQSRLDAMQRAQRERRPRDHGMVRHDGEVVLLGNGRKHQNRFHHGKGVADALPWAAAEGKVRKLRQALGGFAFPAFRQKALGLDVPARVTMHDPLRHQYRSALGDRMSADYTVVKCLATDDVGCRVQPHGLEHRLEEH